MKVIVNKRFRDKHTKELYQPGQVVELSDERVAEVNEALPGFIDVQREPPQGAAPPNAELPEATEQNKPAPKSSKGAKS